MLSEAVLLKVFRINTKEKLKVIPYTLQADYGRLGEYDDTRLSALIKELRPKNFKRYATMLLKIIR